MKQVKKRKLPASNARLEMAYTVHEWAALQPDLLWIFDAPVEPGKGNISEIRDRQVSALLVRKGSVSVTADGAKAKAKKGQWVICQGRNVEQEVADSTVLLTIRCLLGWPTRKPMFSGGPLHLIKADDHPAIERRARALLRLAGHIGWESPTAYLARNRVEYNDFMKYEVSLLQWIGSLVQALAAQGAFIQPSGLSDQRLAKCCKLLDSLSFGGPFPVAEVEAAAGLSLSQINRICRIEHGCSLQNYRERRRLERAIVTLKEESTPIKEVAYDLGFMQLSHFSAWFKRNTGSPPRDYRKGSH